MKYYNPQTYGLYVAYRSHVALNALREGKKCLQTMREKSPRSQLARKRAAVRNKEHR